MEDIKEERERSSSHSPRQSRSRSRSRSPKKNTNDHQRPFMGGRRVIVRNIPYEVRWQELKDLFRKDVGDVTYVEMLETPDGKSKGVAVVEFKDPEHAKKAIEDFHQKKIKDRAIIVREEREKDRQEFLQHKNMKDGIGLGPGMGGGGMGHGVPGIPPGISPHILQQLGIEGPITSTVFVANLDYKVTWWKLKDVFKLAGNVLKAEIKEDKNGQSRGMGIVMFEHPMEAIQAVSMFNGQVLYDRSMIVRIDKGGPDQEKLKLPSGLKSIGMGLGSGGAPLTNISHFGNNLGMCGGGGLVGLGNLGGGNSGLGLLGPGGNDLGLGMGGLGFGGSGGLGMGGFGGSDMGYGGLGGSSKLGALSDHYSGSYNGSGNLSGLGGLGPSLSSLSAGLGGYGGIGDRLGMGDSLGLSRDRLAMERLAGMGGFDRISDRLRDGYGIIDDRRKPRNDSCTVIVKNLPYSANWQALKEHFRDV
ncbi:unnamed protein product, partial [Candidula unifasciata]